MRETAWVIEFEPTLPDGRAFFWGRAGDKDETKELTGLTVEFDRAIRYCRKIDAEVAMRFLPAYDVRSGLTAIPREHIWDDGKPPCCICGGEHERIDADRVVRNHALLQAAATIYASTPFAAAMNLHHAKYETWFKEAVDQASCLLAEIQRRPL